MKNVFRYLDDTTDQHHVYIVDEAVTADKNADHVCYILYLYRKDVLSLNFKSMLLKLDSTGYFKSKSVIWWAAEMLLSERFNDAFITYMVPGNIKFEPDVLFSYIANRFYKIDVFNTSELIEIVSACTTTVHHINASYMRK